MPTVDRELLELMIDTITVERQTGFDEYGQRSYGAPFVLEHCRIEGRTRRVMAQNGTEKVSSVTVYLSETPGLTPLDRVTLPAPWVPTQPEILSVERQSDENGPYYEAINCA